jgi:glycosyltransferase involved in cell wall biosynthesis
VNDQLALQEPSSVAAAGLPLSGSDVDITFFVACYNEEENIIPTLDTLLAALGESPWSWEILVIDDASTDRSAELVRRFVHDHPGLPVRLKVNEVNKGLAHNFTEGAFLGRGQYYRLVCGDNVEPKETFVALLKRLGEADMIIPYHIRCEGKALYRRLLSKAYVRLVNGISGYRIKYYNGLTVHRRYNVMRWHNYTRGFGFQADLIVRLLDEGCTYTEVLVTAHERTKGKAKAMNLKNYLSVAHTLLELIIRRLARFVYNRGRRAGRLPGVGEERLADTLTGPPRAVSP